MSTNGDVVGGFFDWLREIASPPKAARILECERCDVLDAELTRLHERVVLLEAVEERAAVARGILERHGDLGGMPALRALRGEEVCPEPVRRVRRA